MRAPGPESLSLGSLGVAPRSPTVKALILLIFASAFHVGCTATIPNASAKRSDELSKRIIGRWLGPRKFIIFHADGTWAVQRNEDAEQVIDGRRWHINGNELTLASPYGSDSETIVSFSRTKFITKDGDHTTRYDRAPQ